MNPAFLDNMSWEMAEVYGAIQDQILINLAHYFPYFNAANLPRSAFAYQADMLAQMGQVNKQTMRIIRNNLADADEALTGCLEAAIMDSLKSVNPSLYDAARRGIFKMPVSHVVAPNQMQAFNLYYQQSATKLNLVNTVMLESTQSAYQQAVSGIVAEMELSEKMNRLQIAIDTAAGETITGVSSWNTALKHATDRMKENGITGFIDHGGHHWSAEAYAAMDIRTTVANTARAAVWEQNANFGNDLYLVSSHNGARPLCYPWQNKVISSLNRSGVTYDLDGNEIEIIPQNATSYGEPAGLFGINCRHTCDPFIPGVSVADGTPQDEAANDKAYAESQQQRSLERKIREEKRDLLMMKAQGASDAEIKAQREKIRKTDDDIDAFCEQTGRTRRQNREAVYTKRDFPSKDSYDVTQFEREQKEQIEKFYKDGGAQQGKTFGVMTPNEPITPATPPPVTPTPSTPVVNNVAQQATQTTPPVVQSSTATSELVTQKLPATGIQTVDLVKWDHTPTDAEIVAAIGGEDRTRGSCASVALSYAGNKAGYQVHDFRGGDSMDWFSRKFNTAQIAKLPGIDGTIVESANEISTANKLLKSMEVGHEYFLGVGRHASIVRRAANGGFEYLELQSTSSQNGWHQLDDLTLKYRFGAVKRRSYPLLTRLMDVDKLAKNPDFIETLKYINTNIADQKKGVGGGIK